MACRHDAIKNSISSEVTSGEEWSALEEMIGKNKVFILKAILRLRIEAGWTMGFLAENHPLVTSGVSLATDQKQPVVDYFRSGVIPGSMSGYAEMEKLVDNALQKKEGDDGK